MIGRVRATREQFDAGTLTARANRDVTSHLGRRFDAKRNPPGKTRRTGHGCGQGQGFGRGWCRGIGSRSGQEPIAAAYKPWGPQINRRRG